MNVTGIVALRGLDQRRLVPGRCREPPVCAVGGHWVTLVGYDLASNELIVHDPAPRAGRAKSSERVTFRSLTAGRLAGNKSGLPTDARGYLQLVSGMHLSARADTAIIDGVVLLEL